MLATFNSAESGKTLNTSVVRPSAGLRMYKMPSIVFEKLVRPRSWVFDIAAGVPDPRHFLVRTPNRSKHSGGCVETNNNVGMFQHHTML